MTLNTIKRTANAIDNNGNKRGWIVYYDKEKIIEIKSLFNPKKYKGKHPVYSDKQIIKILLEEKRNLLKK
jgi:hypothetical protein|tara:strand:- start:1520 stop:1729 length:210 start_codon:yes stop_codon:yes gene_type:complete